MAGIMKMMEYTLCVTKRSYNILKEFRNYVYAQDKEGRWLNKPIDSYNHAIDAIRYVVLDKLLGESPEDETDYEEIGRAAY
jgi:phage terminase large subunit